MEASPARVIQYFNGEKQHLIPLFQRPYTWTQNNWQTLWDDLMVQYEDEGDNKIHFMGAIVSVPARTTPIGVSKYLIIDGQQRLATVSILLCVLRDILDSNSASRIHEVYLTNKFRDLEDTLKFVPTQADRDVYRAIALDRQVPKNKKDIGIAAAYHFFRNKLLSGADVKIDANKVLVTLEQCLQVVMINLGDDDDPYLIFESLNFKGEPLTQADLVRNYLLMRFRHSISSDGEQARIYSTYWAPLESTLTSSLTEFLRHYMMKDGNDIKKSGIYAAIKTRLKSMDLKETKEVEEEVSSMHRFGTFYAKFLFPKQEEVTSIRDRLENLKDINVTTPYPLLLRLFDVRQNKTLSDVVLEKCLGLVESFVIRRAVCGVPTNSLNKLFIQLAKNFPKTDWFQWLQDSLSSFSGNLRFPLDDEFASAFMTQPQYGLGSTRFILCRLEKSFKHKEAVDLSTATIEHILPQSLNQEWKNELGSEAEKVHTTLVDTFGNLTLTGYNPELGNLSFLEKKAKLENTHIELNRWILQQTNWRAAEIEERAKELLVIANKIWMSPSEMTAD